MWFFLGVTFSMFIGRKIGWGLSRGLLYSASIAVCVIACLIWGLGTAYLFRVLVIATNPGLLLKIYGYGAAAYTSIPNYGLLDENSIPDAVIRQHVIMKAVPFFVFIIASIALAFFVSIG